eukprot:NODE_112_length_2496_cov_38.565182_g59_i1.p16 GENE.NODE_112_length_2496_cov_38.565182_g59_i1~~NODE_112_length_2496_cov_38.565182_g59_i1.p16  ORF type:complete len:54 (-),score=1.67 NODE_112_length_2496_cov_38.565182_g59_i1:1259-1420(-)
MEGGIFRSNSGKVANPPSNSNNPTKTATQSDGEGGVKNHTQAHGNNLYRQKST